NKCLYNTEMCESGGESTDTTKLSGSLSDPGAPASEVQALLDAVAGLLRRSQAERSVEAITDEVRVLRGAMERLDLVLARLIGPTVKRFEEWEGVDEFGPVHWLRHEVHMSFRQA